MHCSRAQVDCTQLLRSRILDFAHPWEHSWLGILFDRLLSWLTHTRDSFLSLFLLLSQNPKRAVDQLGNIPTNNTAIKNNAHKIRAALALRNARTATATRRTSGACKPDRGLQCQLPTKTILRCFAWHFSSWSVNDSTRSDWETTRCRPLWVVLPGSEKGRHRRHRQGPGVTSHHCARRPTCVRVSSRASYVRACVDDGVLLACAHRQGCPCVRARMRRRGV
jgi:hypothetical protein